MTKSSSLINRNVIAQGRRTSIRLEPQMWNALREIAAREKMTVNELCTLIDQNPRRPSSLTSAIRLFIMMYFKAAATEAGHRQAGHGKLKDRLALKGTVIDVKQDKSKTSFEQEAGRARAI